VSGDHRKVVIGRQLFAGVAVAMVAFGSSESSWLHVRSELASDSQTGRRGGGNTFGQLDQVSSERAPERRSKPAVG
jgi:hypothetical protein